LRAFMDLIQQLSPEQIQEYQEAFRLFDKDGNGKIDKFELAEVMKALGSPATPQDIEDMINEVDLDRNGTIEFNEFMIMMGSQKNEEEELKNAFRTFDKNGDGYISRDELKLVMASLGESLKEEEIEEMMREADENRDGKLDFKEFCAMMKLK